MLSYVHKERIAVIIVSSMHHDKSFDVIIMDNIITKELTVKTNNVPIIQKQKSHT